MFKTNYINCFSNRYYNTYVNNNNYNPEIIEKHFPPASREWKNSVYSFNKNSNKDIALKDKLTSDITWTYFSSTPYKKTRKSRRMLSLIARSTTKKLFVSKPEIKQTVDKSIVTMYVFDRQSQTSKVRLFYQRNTFIKNWLHNIGNLVNKSKVLDKKETSKSLNITSLLSENKMKSIEGMELRNKLSSRYKFKYLELLKTVLASKPNILSSSFLNLYFKPEFAELLNGKDKLTDRELRRKKSRLLHNRKNLLRVMKKRMVRKAKINFNILPRYVINNTIGKHKLIKNIFIFSFLKWCLKKLFSIDIIFSHSCPSCKELIFINTKSSNNFKNKCSKCGVKHAIPLSKNILLIKNDKTIIKLNNILFNIDLVSINIILSRVLNKYLHSSNTLNNKTMLINYLFLKFKKLNYKHFVIKFLSRELKILSLITKMQFNKFKYTDYTSSIKNFISSIYNKNIELNLINLKYLHLNSDMFMESLAIKLRKRKSRLLRVLRKSLKLVKRPFMFNSMFESKSSLIKDSNLNVINNTFNKIQSIYDDNKFNYNLHCYQTANNILNDLKYKWVSGIRLEAKGRLTKRYTASRAVFKHLSRGNLKNLDKLYLDIDHNKPVSVYMIRNEFKPNLQHTYKYSNKRIGTFGLKTWINSV